MFGPRSLLKMWKWLCVCENEATVYSHHGSAVKLRNVCRRNLAQLWFSWSSPVVPDILVETQTKVTKGQKMDRTEAVKTIVLYFQRYRL